jgi:hypothetical protein
MPDIERDSHVQGSEKGRKDSRFRYSQDRFRHEKPSTRRNELHRRRHRFFSDQGNGRFSAKNQGRTYLDRRHSGQRGVRPVARRLRKRAKAYILYRKQHEKLRNVGATMLDFKKTVDNYLNSNDWRVKENSTVTYSVGGLILSNSGAITANYWLSEVYDER